MTLRPQRVVTSALLATLCCACAVDEPAAGPDETGRVAVLELGPYGPPQLDLLFVIDSSSAMAPYQARMDALPAIIEQAYLAIGCGVVDMHIAVTTDGTLRQVPSVGGSFISIRTEFDFARITNTSSTLVDSLTSLTAVDAQSPAPNEPLASVERVVTENPDGFIRPYAPLAVVFISASDDASPRAPADYVQATKAAKSDPANVFLVGITAAASPRLDAFFANFPRRTFRESLADGDLIAVLTNLGQALRGILPSICFHASDVDLVAPGPQYDCTVTATIRNTPRVFPPCVVSGDQFCWSLVDASDGCSGFDYAPLRPQMPPYYFNTFMPAFRMECVVTD